MREQASEPLEIIDTFYTDEPVIDRWTVVFNERNPLTGYHTMLALDYDARMFSQFTEGQYTPDGDNSHLGNQVCLIGKKLVEHVAGRLSDGEADETNDSLPDDLTPEDVTYYNLCARSAWNEYQATGDDSYARICLAYFAKMLIAKRIVNEGSGEALQGE